MKISKITNHGLVRWRVATVVAGKQLRRFFATKTQADTYATSHRAEIERSGIDWLTIPNGDRLDCLCALQIARKHGFTLTDAARGMSMGQGTPTDIPTVEAAVASCMARKRTLNLRPRSLVNLQHTLDRFALAFGTRLVSTLKPGEIETWLLGLKVATATRKGHQTNVQTFFSHCASLDWVLKNPVCRIPQPVLDDKPPGILTVQQSEDLIRACASLHPEFVPFFALCLFMGIRPQEVLNIKPEAVDLARGFVTVDVGSSKTRRRRIVTMSDNAKAWLSASGPLDVKNWCAKWLAVRKAAGLTFRRRLHRGPPYEIHQTSPGLADGGVVPPVWRCGRAYIEAPIVERWLPWWGDPILHQLHHDNGRAL